VVDLKTIRSELESSAGGAQIPKLWYRGTVFIVDVEFERQRKLADGSWGETTLVAALPGAFSFRPEIVKNPDVGLRDAVWEYLADPAQQRQIVQPDFLPTKRGNFSPGAILADAGTASAGEDPEIRRLRLDVAKKTIERDRLEEDLTGIGGPLDEAPKDDKKRDGASSGNRSGSGSAGGASGGRPGGGGGFGRPGGPGGGGGGARPAGGRRIGAGGPDVTVYGSQDPLPPPQPGILSGNGAVFVGSKGLLSTVERGEGVKLLPEDKWKDYTLPSQVLTRSPGHMADWVRACKGGDMSCSDFSISVPYVEWVLLGVIAFRVPGKLMWDSKMMRFTNSEEANKLLKPIFRKGWELKL
jgi:uncharacterized membrane protein YgcG